MKNLIDILESKQIQYHVALNEVEDSEGLPITVTILVDKENSANFEKWLEKEQDNLFMHAEGGNIEY